MHHIPVWGDMSETIQAAISSLEAEYSDPSGFLWKVRNGDYDPAQGEAFLAVLEAIQPPEEDWINRRLVALLWYIPQILAWNSERILERGGDPMLLGQLRARAEAAIEAILGVP